MLSIHPLIHPFIRPSNHPSILSSFRPSFLPSFLPSIHSFIHAIIHSNIHTHRLDQCVLHLIIDSSIHKFLHSSIHPQIKIHSSNHLYIFFSFIRIHPASIYQHSINPKQSPFHSFVCSFMSFSSLVVHARRTITTSKSNFFYVIRNGVEFKLA